MTIKESIKEDIEGALKRAAFRIHREIVEETPVDTGRLRNSIVIQKDGDGWVIGTNLEYALAVENGTVPHEIRPRKKKVLAWRKDRKRTSSANPPDTFAKKVFHPGTQGAFMFQKGFSSARRILSEEIKKKKKR